MTPPTNNPFVMHPHGRINWEAPRTRQAIMRMFREGHSMNDIAVRYGVSPAAIKNGVRRYSLHLPPAPQLLLPEVALSFGLSVGGIHALIKRAGLPIRYWGGRRVLLEQEVEALRQRRGHVVPTVDVAPDGYASSKQLGIWWGCSVFTVLNRLNSAEIVPSYQQRTKTSRLIPLYDTRRASDVAPPPAQPRTRPTGHLSTAEVAELTGMSQDGVVLWVKIGAPHCQLLSQRQYMFHPERLAAWLESRPQERTRRKARPLRRLIASQQQRAA